MLEYKPAYVKLAEAIGERIIDGTYPVGSMLPSRQDLAAEFDTSYTTARAGMRLLERDGLISSSQGRPARVLRAPRRDATWMSTELMDALRNAQTEIERLLTVGPNGGLTALDLFELNRRILLVNVLADQ